MKLFASAAVAFALLSPVLPVAAQTTADMYEMAAKDFQAEDGKLNAAYKKLMGALDEEGKKRLVAAQRAWIDFRDKEASFGARHSAGGTMEKLEYMAAKTELTKQRAAELLREAKTGE